MTDKNRTFDDLVAAAVEGTLRDERAAEAKRLADEEERQRERIVQFKSVLEACLDPVITDACALRYEKATTGSHVQAALTVDDETWTITTDSWPRGTPSLNPLDPARTEFSFRGPQQIHGTADKEKLQQALLTAIAKRRQQRASAGDSE
jgi:hypothetical protein